jgi:hypothetical protein
MKSRNLQEVPVQGEYRDKTAAKYRNTAKLIQGN